MGLSALLQKLLFVNKFNVIDGKIEILGNRYIMLNASDILVLQKIDKTKMYKVAKDMSKADMKGLVDHAAVYKNIKDQSLKNIAELSKKIGKNEDGVIKTIQSLFELYGLGKLNILNLDNDKKMVSLEVKDSTIALVQLKKAKSKTPVCTLTAGIVAGIFSYIFKKDVDCVETKCHSQGEEICSFEVS